MLYFALLSASFCVFPVDHPLLPLGQGRLRVILHATNTEDELIIFVDAIFKWIAEIRDIEEELTPEKESKAAREVHAWMKREGLTGFGLQ